MATTPGTRRAYVVARFRRGEPPVEVPSTRAAMRGRSGGRADTGLSVAAAGAVRLSTIAVSPSSPGAAAMSAAMRRLAAR